MIKLKILREKITLDYPAGSRVITMVQLRGKVRKEREIDVTRIAEEKEWEIGVDREVDLEILPSGL